YRIRVPIDLVSTIGRTHINRSLRTTSRPLAQRAMIAVGYELDQFFDSVRDGKVVTPARHPKAQPAPVAAQLSSEIMTLRKAYDVYLADPSRKASPKTL